MGKVDLHMHSIYSDGSLSPKELLDEGEKIGLEVMALTDHDTIEGSKDFIKANKGRMYVYSGVEMTAKVNKGRMHILGYNIDLDNHNLNKKLKEIKEDSIYNFLLYVEILRKKFKLDIPQYLVDEIINAKGNIGRPQLAILLVNLGFCTDVEDAFQKYLISAYETVRTIKKGVSKEECISLIKEAGGVISLAHPSSLKMTEEELDREIAYLKGVGLDAIEVIHINNNDRQRLFYHELAKKYDLLETGGTDFHGLTVKPDVYLGTGRTNNVDINIKTLSFTRNVKSRYMK